MSGPFNGHFTRKIELTIIISGYFSHCFIMIYFALCGKYVAIAHKRTLPDSALVQELLVYLRLHQ